MTYCVGLRLNAGLVFLADSRTNAGVDQIGVFRKMTVFERPGERVMVLLTSGNLGVTQSVRQLLLEPDGDGVNLWNAANMHEAAIAVGNAVRRVHERDAAHLQEAGIEFNCTLILGGQIRGERCRLFEIYPAGNFIEALDENLYFQIGELKYGKPILDRVVTPATTLDEAAKCALISMDSTLRSNLSVGLPLDLLCYETGALRVTRFAAIDSDNEYFRMLRTTWGQRLKQVFWEIPDPHWNAQDPAVRTVEPVRAPAPAGPKLVGTDPPVMLQSFAGGSGAPRPDTDGNGSQHS